MPSIASEAFLCSPVGLNAVLVLKKLTCTLLAW
jgi:hypothetical protein